MKKKDVSTEGWSTGHKQAHIDRFSDRIVVYPISTCLKGWGLAVGPAVVLEPTATPEEIANAAAKCWEMSNDRWPPPADLDESSKPLFKAMNIKSWKEYKPLAAVDVERRISDGRISLMPLKRDRRGGYEPVLTRERWLPADINRQELGQKIQRAIDRSAEHCS